jgi:serine/threonine-protein kinase
MSDPTTRLRRAETLFHEALRQAPAERPEFLRRACAGDDDLLGQVERLLASDAEDDGFLTAPAIGREFVMPSPESLGQLTGGTPAPPAQRRIGAYQLVRLLGSGGIANVWLARRVDEHFEKEVAIKLIKRGMDTEAILARFRQERQLLARLEHPNLARLIDGEATDDGRPYLVMELVDGVPIHRYCAARELSVAQRIRLSLEICGAVQYAHQNLVIHRDIKPGNILVTADGRPKLLDFGIAKVLTPKAGEATSVTAGEARLMTPEYASPEQIRGGAVTTSSDIYSLGVVLYELLTTQSPYGSSPRTRGELERLVCEREAPRPSTRVLRAARTAPAMPETAATGRTAAPAPRTLNPEPPLWPEGDPVRLSRLLRGDLDTILLKALAKEPGRRYASVEQLAEDLRRYLVRLPIAARPPTWGYRSRRFIQRHTAGVIAAGLAVVAIVAGLIVSSTAYLRADAALKREAAQRELADQRRHEAETARAQALAESAKVRATNDFLQELLATDDPVLKLRPSVQLRTLLDEAGRALDGGALSDQPEVEAAVRTTIGRTYTDLRMPNLGEPHLRRALALRGPDVAERIETADTMAQLARSLCEQSMFAEGIPLHRRALAARRALAPDDEEALMRRQWSLSTALRDDGRPEEAEPVAREALEIALRLYGPRHANTAESRFRLGFILSVHRKLDEAEAQQREALALQRALLGARHPACGESLLRLGQTLIRKRQAAEGESLVREAVQVLREAYGEEHPSTSRARSNLARLLASRGSYGEAEALLAEVAENASRYYGYRNSNVGNVLLVWARVRAQRGDLAGAEPLMREALELFTADVGPDHSYTQSGRLALADLLVRQGCFADAEPLLLEAHGTGDGAGERGGADRRRVAERLADLYEKWSDAEPDERLREHAAEWRERAADPE